MRILLFISCMAVAISASAYSGRYPVGAGLDGDDDFLPVLAAEVKGYGMHGLDVNAMHCMAPNTNEDNSEPLSLDVKVEKAGDLKTVLGDNINKVDVLRVEGPINYDDYNTIWESTFLRQVKGSVS